MPASAPPRRPKSTDATPKSAPAGQTTAIKHLSQLAPEEARAQPTEAISFLQELQQRAEKQYLLLSSSELAYDPTILDDKKTILTAQLDLVLDLVRDDATLRAIFEQHALMSAYCPRPTPRTKRTDSVQDEISQLVTIKWNDRKKPELRDHHWAWLKRPDLFIAHIYKRWLDEKSLRLRHIRNFDRELYAAYFVTISRHPARTLLIESDAESAPNPTQNSTNISSKQTPKLKAPTQK